MARDFVAADHCRMPRRPREFWSATVAELERSGERDREFAAKRGLTLVTLRYWIYRLRRERRKTVPIVPVRVVASTAPSARQPSDSSSTVEVELPSGLRVRFPAGTDEDYIVRLAQRLG